MDGSHVVTVIVAVVGFVGTYFATKKKFETDRKSAELGEFVGQVEGYSKLVQDLREQVRFLRDQHSQDRKEWTSKLEQASHERRELLEQIKSLEAELGRVRRQVEKVVINGA